jgi:hypothetical protein
MRINGKLIGRLGGHTEDSPALVNRFVEIYMTKTKMKIYLFNSSVKGWRNPNQVLQIVDVKLNKDVRELISEYLNILMRINNIRFNGTFTYEGVKYRYDNGIEVYEADNGTMLKDIEGKVYYHGDYGENGAYYKDLNAWNTNKGVIYISEGDLDDIANEISDNANLWTKESWIKWVTDFIYDNYGKEEGCAEMLADTKFIESLAYDCLDNADWQDLSTLLNEYDYNNNWVWANWEDWQNK